MSTTGRRQVVALCGRLGAGKDALADALCRDSGFVNLKFARPLKDALCGIFGLTSEHVDGDLKDVVHPAWGVTPRLLMQWFGTDVMQHGLAAVVPHVGRTVWSERMRLEILKLPADGATRVVISDTRFQHEVDMVRSLAAAGEADVLVVHVLCSAAPEHKTYRSEAAEAAEAHESESGVDDLGPVDQIIVNDGTLADLRAKLAIPGIPGILGMGKGAV
jgi:hypothetical protein